MPELVAGGGSPTSGPGPTRSAPGCLASGQIKGAEYVLLSWAMCVMREPCYSEAPCLPGQMPAGDLHNGDEQRLREPL